MGFVIVLVLVGCLAYYFYDQNRFKERRTAAMSGELQVIFEQMNAAQALSTAGILIKQFDDNKSLIKDLQKVFRRWHKLGMNKYEGADVSEVSLKPQEQAALNDMDTVCGKLVPLLRRSWPPGLDWPLDDLSTQESGRLMAHLIGRFTRQ